MSVRKRRLGARKWLTEPELISKYQSARVATRIIESKLNDKELAKTQVRFHPDAPDDDETRLEHVGMSQNRSAPKICFSDIKKRLGALLGTSILRHPHVYIVYYAG